MSLLCLVYSYKLGVRYVLFFIIHRSANDDKSFQRSYRRFVRKFVFGKRLFSIIEIV